MDKYFRIATLFLFAAGIEGAEQTCTDTRDCSGNQICTKLPSNSQVCRCPRGFEGADCQEYSTDNNERCILPRSSFFPSTCDPSGGCKDDQGCLTGEICCTGLDGCSTKCMSRANTCANSGDCPNNKMCTIDTFIFFVNVCTCPVYYNPEMDECIAIGVLDTRCPYPDSIIDFCYEIEQKCSPGPCSGGEVCCAGREGCSSECVSLEQTCADTIECSGNQICTKLPGDIQVCRCPRGFEGVDCQQYSPDNDEKCSLPISSSLVSVCDSVNNPLRQCEDSAACSAGEICCTSVDGCSTQCEKTVDTCVKTDDCPSRKVCKTLIYIKKCVCPLLYDGIDCMDGDFDDRCPYPNDLSDVCRGFTNNCFPPFCPEGKVCCTGTDGCSNECVSLKQTCADTNECSGNQICTKLPDDTQVCRCPRGFEGADCQEYSPDNDERCVLPNNLISVCDPVNNHLRQCEDSGTCPAGSICCTGLNGCDALCMTTTDSCVNTDDCSPNTMCSALVTSFIKLCACPYHYEGNDCMDGLAMDDRCPYPNDLIDVCRGIQLDCFPGSCSGGEICCTRRDGCSTECVSLEQTCADTNECSGNQICTKLPDDTQVCRCPRGFEGADCQEYSPDNDERCVLPNNLISVCDPVNNRLRQCEDSGTCPAGEICCTKLDGCDALCMRTADSCVNTDECSPNTMCSALVTSFIKRCDCPYSYEGNDCMDGVGVDSRCSYPNDLIDICRGIQFDCACSGEEICCTGRDGCSTECVSLDGSCTSTTQCSNNKMCYKETSESGICICPFGYTGSNCMERFSSVDERCPYPSDLIGLCTDSIKVMFECNYDDKKCSGGEICCPASNGCSIECVPIGCTNPADLKKCTDKKKLCVNEDSTDGYICKCPLGYSGLMCATLLAGFDEDCPFPEVPGDICNEFEEPICTKADDCEDHKVCCSTGCGTTCVDLDKKPPGKKINSKLALILLFMSSRRQRPRNPVHPTAPKVPIVPVYTAPPRVPVTPIRCQPYRCVCSKNLGAICQPSIGGCGVNIFDQHTRKLITPLCRCDPGYKIYSPCSKGKCFDVNGKPLVCLGHPNAKCRVTQCGRCQEYWIDIITGKQVTCETKNPDNSGAACGPGETQIYGCPDVCHHTRCPKYPDANCTVRACNGCTARYIYKGKDVTRDCHQYTG